MARVYGPGAFVPSVPELKSADTAPCPYCATLDTEYLFDHRVNRLSQRTGLTQASACTAEEHKIGRRDRGSQRCMHAPGEGDSQDQVAVALHDQVGRAVHGVQRCVLGRRSRTPRQSYFTLKPEVFSQVCEAATGSGRLGGMLRRLIMDTLTYATPSCSSAPYLGQVLVGQESAGGGGDESCGWGQGGGRWHCGQRVQGDARQLCHRCTQHPVSTHAVCYTQHAALQ